MIVVVVKERATRKHGLVVSTTEQGAVLVGWYFEVNVVEGMGSTHIQHQHVSEGFVFTAISV